MSTNMNMEFASVQLKTDQTSSSAANATRPTIFDILAQENMHALLRPSFNHVLKWLSATHPRLTGLQAHAGKLYLVAHSLLELVYIRECDSLFTEYFYGLKRIGLTPGKRALSVIGSVVLPYLKVKLDEFYEELEATFDPNQLEDSSSQNVNDSSKSEIYSKNMVKFIKKQVLRYYQYFHLFWSLAFWYERFRFAINQSDVHSPVLRALGLKLIYDLRRVNTGGVLSKLLQVINYCFTNVLFFVQFVKWFYEYRENRTYGRDETTLEHRRPSHDVDRELIDEPRLAEKLTQSKAYKTLNEKGLCPLCNKKRTNQCALTVSGFVFCYPCIFRFVKENKRCPLTNFPCSTKNIVRIYATID